MLRYTAAMSAEAEDQRTLREISGVHTLLCVLIFCDPRVKERIASRWEYTTRRVFLPVLFLLMEQRALSASLCSIFQIHGIEQSALNVSFCFMFSDIRHSIKRVAANGNSASVDG